MHQFRMAKQQSEESLRSAALPFTVSKRVLPGEHEAELLAMIVDYLSLGGHESRHWKVEIDVFSFSCN